MFLLGFFIGGVLGGNLGVFLMALFKANKN
jgi:hypothetical protein